MDDQYQGCLLDFASIKPADLDLTALWSLPVRWQTYEETSAINLSSRLHGQEIILTNKVELDEATLAQNPQIKLIIILATGTNNVDLQAASALGIAVCNIENYSTQAVAQHTMMLILALKTNLLSYCDAVVNKKWSQSNSFCMLDYPIEVLAGQTLAVLGFGHIGKQVKKLAEAFGMQVLVCESLYSSKPNRTSFENCLQEADVVSLHLPLVTATKNLIDATALAMMKPSAVLVNVARGGLVDEKALLAALKAGKLAAAGLDVLQHEPPQIDNPMLLNTPNLIVTPHCAWGARQSRQKLMDNVVDILLGFIQGKPIKPIN